MKMTMKWNSDIINVKVRKNGKKNRVAAVELDKASMAYLRVNQVFVNCIFKNIQKWMNWDEH